MDIDDCTVTHPNVDDCYRCSAECMSAVKPDAYDLVFSNYVLEHIAKLDMAAREIARVLKPEGVFIASVPNPQALEFVVARHTPFRFHKFVRGGTGWHTHYTYGSIEALRRIFSEAGLETVETTHYPFIRGYFERFPLLRWLGSLYDDVVRVTGWKRLMGNVCFLTRKTKVE